MNLVIIVSGLPGNLKIFMIIFENIDNICENIDDICENFFNNFDFLNHRGKSGSGSIPRVLWMPPKMLFLIASFPKKNLVKKH